jgi:hypothetical protein
VTRSIHLPEDQRIKFYTKDYFLWGDSGGNDRDRADYHVKRLRSNQVDAIGYAYGYTNNEDIKAQYTDGGDFRAQIAALKNKQTRHPKLAVDVGTGRGELATALYYGGTPTFGVDPTPGSRECFYETTKWVEENKRPDFINKGIALGLFDIYNMLLRPDTIILCETIEHIPIIQFEMALPIIIRSLSENQGLLIITGFIEDHPIRMDGTGWDHITYVDDAYYDWIENKAKRTVFRKGTHLVLEF